MKKLENQQKMIRECFWCEKPTKSHPERIMNGFLEWEWVAFCKNCKKAQKEYVRLISKAKKIPKKL